jgi:hypothetical protein
MSSTHPWPTSRASCGTSAAVSGAPHTCTHFYFKPWFDDFYFIMIWPNAKRLEEVGDALGVPMASTLHPRAT